MGCTLYRLTVMSLTLGLLMSSRSFCDEYVSVSLALPPSFDAELQSIIIAWSLCRTKQDFPCSADKWYPFSASPSSAQLAVPAYAQQQSMILS
jgi:hypothetical protein